MTAGLGTAVVILSVVAAVVWLLVACCVPRLREAQRPRALTGLVVAGVPLAGWLTYCFGPLVGIMAMIGAVVALLVPPRPRRRKTPLPVIGAK